MNRPRRLFLCQLGLFGAAGLRPAAAVEAWPQRPLRLIVPAAAGGPYDRLARPLAEALAQQLRQPVIVDNRGGAAGLIGAQAAAAAAPDGHTLVMTGTVDAIASARGQRGAADLLSAFEPVGAISTAPHWLVAQAGSGVPDFAALLERARREPGRVGWATSGPGSMGHLVMALLERDAGLRFLHVPYKGGAPALQDLLAGRVTVALTSPNGALAQVRAGQLVVLAVSAPARDPLVPQAPSFAELGFGGLTVTSWVGLSVPRGTPAAAVRRLHAALQAALARPVFARQAEEEGSTLLPGTPQDYARRVQDEVAHWARVTRGLDLTAD